MEYLKTLNPQQYEAATHKDGPLLILAGAGSGKTATMTRRIAWLIKEEGVWPSQILAVTFTNKAAGEMRERVESLVGPVTQGMWIQTFHSTCLRILRLYGDRIGYDKNFVVYDTTDQKVVVKNIMKEKNIDEKNYTPSYFLSVISHCKETGMEPERYEALNRQNSRERLVAEVYAEYQKVLKKNNALDFDDLLWKAVQLLKKDPEVLQTLQNKFRYIMVDEYQDTNMMQYTLVKLLAAGHHNLCVVGDDDQCIYQWRGADIRNILDFEKDFPEARIIKLEQNYRSYGNILKAAHSVIENNSSRKKKKLWTEREDGEKIRYCRADDDWEEARFVAREVGWLQGKPAVFAASQRNMPGNEPLEYKDFAVLYRTNAQSRRFEEVFRQMGIPFHLVNDLGFYDRKEIRDLMAYLRLVNNPADDVALRRIINEPKRGIGDKTMEKVVALAEARGCSLLTALEDPDVLAVLPSKGAAAVESMVKLLVSLRDEQENMLVSDIFLKLLEGTGYQKVLQEKPNDVENQKRLENLDELHSDILEYEKTCKNRGEDATLAGFLEGKSLEPGKNAGGEENPEGEENSVSLMTLHTAKGLEFPVVFLVGMDEGVFPGFRAAEREDGLEEERRLCYVGMTRAMARLYLTSAETRTLYGKTNYMRESCFLRELDQSLVTGSAIDRGRRYDRYSQITGDPESYRYDPYSGGSARAFGGKLVNAPAGNYGSGRAVGGASLGSSGAAFTPRPMGQRMPQAARPTVKAADLSIGDRVSHTKFGEGTITAVNGDAATVIFDGAGVKKLALSVAPLKKL
ncbi:MAG: ATP-binding protein [Clostridiales bacterium]|nr:ATP-binding protein [Clostridiales bacterium]